MTIEVALLISGLSVAFGIYMGITNNKRNQKADAQKEASEMTTVIVKLENIGAGINEIKQEMSGLKKDVKDQGDNQIRIEESLKGAWKRIEIIEAKKG